MDIWYQSFLCLFIVWFLVRAYYGTKAKKNHSKGKVRPGVEKALVGLNFIGMMILPLVALFTPLLDPFQMQIPDAVRTLFLFIVALNIALFAKVHADLGSNWSPILEIKAQHHLVKTGVYRTVRHPMYTHLWLWVFSQGIVLNNWIVLVYGVTAWGILYVIRVPKEEEMLLQEFGDDYQEYMNKTGRVIPKVM